MPSIFPEDSERRPLAILALADGTVFKGISIGAQGSTVAEIIFNTALSGYQEGITDPGSSGNIITFTYPHIGNTGINTDDMESSKVHAAGLVIRDCPHHISNFRANKTLPKFLQEQGIVAIAGVDTRKITRILRDRGTQAACILVGDDVEQAIQMARDYQSKQSDLGVKEPTSWTQGTWQLGKGFGAAGAGKYNVAVYDFGVKANVLRQLVDRGCNVSLIPANTPAADILAKNPDGVILSGGPGKPEDFDFAIASVKELLAKNTPIFGLGLGMQILASAVGAKSVQLKTGNHGANHPVKDLSRNRVYISTQSHGTAIARENLPAEIKITHKSLFDDSIQGFEIDNHAAFGFQGQAESSPGPQDMVYLFDKFISSMSTNQTAK